MTALHAGETLAAHAANVAQILQVWEQLDERERLAACPRVTFRLHAMDELEAPFWRLSQHMDQCSRCQESSVGKAVACRTGRALLADVNGAVL